MTAGEKTKSLCGTPEYLAPEVFEKKGYGKEVDWWCLGNIIYEMLTGNTPFQGDTREALFKNIKSKPVKFPKYMSEEAKDIINQLLDKDPETRLGCGENGLKNIKNHPFFENIIWEAIFNKDIRPPFIPRIVNKTDTKYFDTVFDLLI